MKTSQSFPHMLNEIFSEFNKAACIRISYRLINSTISDVMEQEIVLTGVNGFISLTSFTDFLSNSRAEATKSLADELKMMETAVNLDWAPNSDR